RGLLHRPDRGTRPRARTPAPLPPRVHPEQRRGDPVGVLHRPRAPRRGARCRHAARRTDPAAAACLRDPHRRGRRAVALPRTPARQRLRALHLEAAPAAGGGAAARDRGAPGPLRAPPPLGESLHHRAGAGACAVPAPGRFPGSARPAGPEPGVPQCLRGPPARRLSRAGPSIPAATSRARVLSVPMPQPHRAHGCSACRCPHMRGHVHAEHHCSRPSPPAPSGPPHGDPMTSSTPLPAARPPADRGRPPMGWNSWDSYGTTVTEAEVLTNAHFLADHLAEYGWSTVVIDIDWSDPSARSHGYNEGAPLVMDEHGRVMPDPGRFPSAADGAGFAPLAEEIHALGLKLGIHVMRGIPRRAVEMDAPVLGSQLRASDIADPSNSCEWNPHM